MHQGIEFTGSDSSLLLLSQIEERTVIALVYDPHGRLRETRVFEKVLALEMFGAAGFIHFFVPGITAISFLKELRLMHAELLK